MRAHLLAVAVLAGLAMHSTQFVNLARAQGGSVSCGPRAELLEMLEANYQEKVVWRGHAEPGVTVELLANSAGRRSWSILVTNKRGRACLVASGRAWEETPDLPGEQDA